MFTDWVWSSSSVIPTGDDLLLGDSGVTHVEGTSALWCTLSPVNLVGGRSFSKASGEIRTRWRLQNANISNRIGVFACMEGSLHYNNSWAYWLQFSPTTALGLYKRQGGGAGTLITTNSPGFTFAAGTWFAMQLRWQKSGSNTILTAHAGTNFTTMTQRLTFTTPSLTGPPLYAGIFAATPLTNADAYFDDTRILEIADA